MKRRPSTAILEKGKEALQLYRQEVAAAKAKGPKFYAEWLAERELRKAQKRISPQMAIKAFCNMCVGDVRADITSCPATKCPLYIYRPYQKGESE